MLSNPTLTSLRSLEELTLAAVVMDVEAWSGATVGERCPGRSAASVEDQVVEDRSWRSSAAVYWSKADNGFNMMDKTAQRSTNLTVR